MFLEISQNSQEKTFARVTILVKLRASETQVFSCEFCEISENTEHLRATASGNDHMSFSLKQSLRY